MGKDHGVIVKQIEEELGVPPLIARILVSRGIKDPSEAETFLYPRLEDLSDPFTLPDIDKGIERLIMGLKKREEICLYGDYDADGITSVAVMLNFLKHLGCSPRVYLPKREEGYGLNVDALKQLKEEGVKLLICLDCGSTNIEEIRFARELGMDVVVIDHHELSQSPPPAYAVINPKRKDSLFNTRELSAAGVTFFFLWALRRVLHEKGVSRIKINLKKELDLVTIGTFGDMVPLVKDNRVIAKFGLENMRRQPRLWLKEFYKRNIIQKVGLIDEYTLNFIIIPRINATGRVGDPEISLEFLISSDEREAGKALDMMNEANIKRQKVSEDVLNEIKYSIEKEGLQNRTSIVAYKEDWHIGVIGIVAQRLLETYGKPSFVITKVDNIWKGSGRGGDNINLHSILSSLSGHLLKFGGHRFACGISLTEENILPFVDAFEDQVKTNVVEKKNPYRIDVEATFDDLSKEIIDYMEMLSPYGVGNPKPELLFEPSTVTTVNNGRIRITDRKKRVWYGFCQGLTPLAQDREVRLIATPFIREEMGSQFICLSVKGAITGEG
ncbi:MAG: single-stranded-DNA-specific exonuclease RecJ [Syntrophorhabdaceae bacterium]|nr:single-stranded-DNA-specific exonuclease RecJ [Syntrophorhabdaceae bacterium]